MDKIKLKKRVKLREKFGDFFLDVSKYLLTVIMLTTLFDDLLTESWAKYTFSFLFILVSVLLIVFYFYKHS
jgi:hypothetical protein